MTRLETLRSRLLPPGTRMADVPATHRGLTYAQWLELQCMEYLVERRNAPQENPPGTAIRTARDSYGWRSLPSGTRLLRAGEASR